VWGHGRQDQGGEEDRKSMPVEKERSSEAGNTDCRMMVVRRKQASSRQQRSTMRRLQCSSTAFWMENRAVHGQGARSTEGENQASHPATLQAPTERTLGALEEAGSNGISGADQGALGLYCAAAGALTGG